MELRYSAAVNSLSAALIMVFSPFVCRFRGQNAIFSASLGIIIYTIVKSIVVECGWGFAVTVGVSVGLLIESSVILFGIILFTEFDRVLRKNNNKKYLPTICVIMICTGKWLTHDFNVIPDAGAFVVGNGGELALLSCAVYVIGKETEVTNATILAAFSAVCAAGCFATEMFLAMFVNSSEYITAPLLIALGCSALLVEFINSIKNKSGISAIGFVSGLMLSCCIDALTG